MNSVCFLIRLIMICSNLSAKINFIVCIIILEAIYRRITTANFIVLVLTSCYELNECKVCADDIITVNSIQNFFIPKVLTNFSQTPVLNWSHHLSGPISAMPTVWPDWAIFWILCHTFSYKSSPNILVNSLGYVK